MCTDDVLVLICVGIRDGVAVRLNALGGLLWLCGCVLMCLFTCCCVINEPKAVQPSNL